MPAERTIIARADDAWPSLPYDDWKDTYETLHMWTQIVGKIRLALSPLINHWWQVTLYVTPRGLTTSPIPYGSRTFEIIFDLIDHNLEVRVSDGRTRYMGLHPRSVADFYQELMSILRALGIEVAIYTKPQEVPNPIACDIDTVHASYDEEYAGRFRKILIETDSIFKEFRGRFIGKCSPVHFFWGSFDLAVTRFSGRRAPEQPGADHVQGEAYSHECSSAGFWPGSGSLPSPAFYAYTVPVPLETDKAHVRPDAAHYDPQLGEFILLYDDMRSAPDPKVALLDFLQSTYEAGADLAGWDRRALER
ncbi:MAG TPA: DUF5996 family protein [Chloroflexia bacterium]|nr:DUF5996 family protein [Chloroflexia bacterium]